MRKFVFALAAAALMVCAAPVFAGQTADKEGLKELNGAAWVESSQAEKLAFLLGVEMMIATEEYLAEKMAEAKVRRGGKGGAAINHSPFMKGWLNVFKNTSRVELAGQLDAYVAANPDARNRHVFEIIWREFIAPQMKQAKKTQTAKGGPWNY